MEWSAVLNINPPEQFLPPPPLNVPPHPPPPPPIHLRPLQFIPPVALHAHILSPFSTSFQPYSRMIAATRA